MFKPNGRKPFDPDSMCGRFTLTATPEQIAEHFGLADVHAVTPRYNIAPSQPVAVVREGEGKRELSLMRWGLIPAWANDRSIGNRMINARAETVAEKPAFRSAFRSRRCLIPADGFYEWTKQNGKQPYYFRLRDGGLFAFAGLWERWGRSGETIESCTLITTETNADVEAVHDRMPVIVHASQYRVWLDPRIAQSEDLQAILSPLSDGSLVSQRVGKVVNSPLHEGPACLESA